MRSGRIVELDGLRGIAVVSVLAWHFMGSMVDQNAGPLQSAVHAATIFGRTGVDLFFVLSGYLIIGIVIDKRRSENFFRVFYTRRAWRIYPPYAALVMAYWGCYLWLGESPGFNTDYGVFVQLVAQLAFLWNWLMALDGGGVARGFSVTWSVAIEEWFYLTFPVMLWIMPRQWLLPFLIVVGSGSALLRAGAALLVEQPGLAPYVLPMFRLDALCLGGILALGRRSPRWPLVVAQRRWLGVASAVFAATLPLVIAACRNDLSRQMFLWGHAYLSLGYALVLCYVLMSIGSSRLGFLRLPTLIWFGTVSYTLYLFHPLFISLYFQLAGRPELVVSWHDAAIAGLAFVSAMVFSAAFYWLVEQPSLHQGTKAQYAAPRDPPMDAAAG